MTTEKMLKCLLLPPLAVIEYGVIPTIIVLALTLPYWIPGVMAAVFIVYWQAGAPPDSGVSSPEKPKEKSAQKNPATKKLVMYCSYCGGEIPFDQCSCPHCGMMIE